MKRYEVGITIDGVVVISATSVDEALEIANNKGFELLKETDDKDVVCEILDWE